ncbi:MAG: hypothetical protein JWQ44_2793 [Chthoniobacter sp.]|nr:hypothetical protein [Chthoniobacter sp.]
MDTSHTTGRAACVAAALGVIWWAGTAEAQSPFLLTTPSYTQDFSALYDTANSTPVPDTTVIPGWYVGSGNNAPLSTSTVVNSGLGDSSSGRNYNFGVEGTNPISDRALGSVAASSTQRNTDFYFQNDTGSGIAELTLSYTGEQWRAGAATSVNNTLVLQYSLNGTDFMAVGPSFDFNSPIDSGPTNGIPLDGNAPANRVTGIGGTYLLPSTLAVGATAVLRWADSDSAANDHGMALDDFSLAATFAAIPLYWDLNGNVAGIGGAAGATWNLTSAFWNASAEGTGTPQMFNPANLAVFGGTPGPVTLGPGGVAPNGGIQFDSTGYVIRSTNAANDKLTLGGKGTIGVTNAGESATISAPIAGAAGLSKTGSGTLILSGANSFTGNVVASAGSLQITSDAALGNPDNDLVLAAGTFAVSENVTLAATRDLTGTGGLLIPATRTLTTLGSVNLSALQLFSGSVSHDSGGVLTLGGTANTLGNVVFNDPVTINAPNGVTITGAVTTPTLAEAAGITGDVAFSNALHAFTITDTPAAVDFFINGNVSSGTAGRLHKLGDGALRLGGPSSSGFAGGVRMGTAGFNRAAGGRIIIADNEALGLGTSLQLQFNDGTLEAEVPLTGANAIPIGLSIGAGQLNGATFAGADVEFLGTSNFFKPASTTLQHRIIVNSNVTLTGALGASQSGGAGSNSSGVAVSGSGSLNLAGAFNGHDLPITLDGPDLYVSGELSAAAATITVSAGTLSGTGSIAGSVSVGDFFGEQDAVLTAGSPAAGSIGTLTVPSLILSNDAVLLIDVNAASLTADKIVGNGLVSIGSGASALSIASTGPLPVGLQFTILENLSPTASDTSGFFAGKPDLSQFTVGPNTYRIDYTGGIDDNDVVLQVLIPEPGTASLSVLAAGLLGLRRRRNISA